MNLNNLIPPDRRSPLITLIKIAKIAVSGALIFSDLKILSGSVDTNLKIVLEIVLLILEGLEIILGMASGK